MKSKTNTITWTTGEPYAVCSFTQKKYINALNRIHDKYPNICEVTGKNDDGSVTANLDLDALHLTYYKRGGHEDPVWMYEGRQRKDDAVEGGEDCAETQD